MDPEREFTQDGYPLRRPFAGFLPGIGGEWGIPVWACYVNRGQGVCSFGFEDKDHAVMEYLPATQAYQLVAQQGFRTFLKSGGRVYEPFHSPAAGRSATQTLHPSLGELELTDRAPAFGLETRVVYFPIVNEPFGALVRRVTVTNISRHALAVELLDGLPTLVPYGITDESLKNRRYLMEAFITVDWAGPNLPLFRVRTAEQDTPDVVQVRKGHFCLCSAHVRGRDRRLTPLIDPETVFGPYLDFSVPVCLGTAGKPSRPVGLANRFPCVFNRERLRLRPGESYTLSYVLGQLDLGRQGASLLAPAGQDRWLRKKQAEHRALLSGITGQTLTASGQPRFDSYCEQNFLDNVLRGGMPFFSSPRAQRPFPYLYTRKHGDLERDYNAFRVPPTYLSQGTGNYRDVNQNRRNDVVFAPRLEEQNLLTFLNLIQLDGYNPLVLHAPRYRLAPERVAAIAAKFFAEPDRARARRVLGRPFTPGEALLELEGKRRAPEPKRRALLDALLDGAVAEERSEHGEGYWIDHWTYTLDLIESYLYVYPERRQHLFLGLREFTFHDSAHGVRARAERTPGPDGAYPRAVVLDEDKARLIRERPEPSDQVRTQNGRGEIYRTTLFVKLLTILLNGLCSLDRSGIGIEMEADKPGWNDALNGLPGLSGSSTCEAFELMRVIDLLRHALTTSGPAAQPVLMAPAELHAFAARLAEILRSSAPDDAAGAGYWESSHALKEDFRRQTRVGLAGTEAQLDVQAVRDLLALGRMRLEHGLQGALDPRTGIYATYLTHRPDAAGPKPVMLPHFLEGNVHALRVETDPERARALYRHVRRSDLYDRKLRMYKSNASLRDQPLEIGRIRAFAPGWLENESVWLHMEYKFLLELLKQGLAAEFFAEARNTLVPFLSPETYGRSPFENSSFIVSSAHPDARRHGKGYYARLSGSTAEFIHMWLLMSAGRAPFTASPAGEVSLGLAPLLPKWLFSTRPRTLELTRAGKPVPVRLERNTYGFMFLGQTFVVYHNPRRKDTFGRGGAKVVRYVLEKAPNTRMEFQGSTLPGPLALAVRSGQFPRIDVYLE